MPDGEYLFVYGTLRKTTDGQLHPFLRTTAEFINTATLPGKLYRLDDYPAAICEINSHSRIKGEIYRLTAVDKCFALLDEYEECTANHPLPHEYRRCKKPITLTDGQQLMAWIYEYNHPTDNLPLIDSGDYFP